MENREMDIQDLLNVQSDFLAENLTQEQINQVQARLDKIQKKFDIQTKLNTLFMEAPINGAKILKDNYLKAGITSNDLIEIELYLRTREVDTPFKAVVRKLLLEIKEHLN
ncbi:hypothetical protein FACS189418_2100 [Clostridia bacterium]|nr:hypothetical protein FACS189418_2100 [Clostridia bacterium]